MLAYLACALIGVDRPAHGACWDPPWHPTECDAPLCWHLCRRWGLVYGILVLLGVGTLMPWNVFMTEKEFWDIRLHQDPFNPFIAHNFMNLFAVTFNLT